MNAPVDIRADRPLEQGFQLGELRVDPPAGEVSGPGGREKLDPKVMDVLVLLAQHAGQVVLREQLLAQLWPNTIVTDDALSRCIYELRRQLSQAGGGESYREMIETVPKRGYRLSGKIAPIQPQPMARQRIRPGQRFLAMAIAIGAAIFLLVIVGQRHAGTPAASRPASAIATTNSIAVLPFVDMSAGQDQGYLSDGISEEITNRLAQIPVLRVIARTSSFSFKDRSVDIPEIAARLNVSHILEGSVRRTGERVRITAQLIDATSNSHLWSETFDREIGDLFVIQDEIAVSVAKTLQIKLANLKRSAPATVSPKALEQFLHGQFFYNRRAPGDIELSVNYYNEAVALDPGYAKAWAALSGAYSLLAWNGKTLAKDLLVKQGETARKAVELDPSLAVARSRLARFYYQTGEYDKAHEQEREAAELDPNESLVLSSESSNAVENNDIDKAVALQRRVVGQDPLSSVKRKNLAFHLVANGQLDEAKTEFRRALELSPSDELDINTEIVRILVLQRRFDEAQSIVAQMPGGKLRDYGLAMLYQAPGHRAEAEVALERLAAQPAEITDSTRQADVYAYRGMNDEAFASLLGYKNVVERAEGSRSWWINIFKADLRLSPFLKPLHADPRWAELLADEPGQR